MTLRKENVGGCKRRGFITLFNEGTDYTYKTTCKTWGCRSCQQKLQQRVEERIRTGYLTLGISYFITVTYAMDGLGELLKDAACVRDHWRRFCRQLKTLGSLSWFQIPELTKRKQIHLHNLIANIGQRVDSCRREKWSLEYLNRECKVDCLTHIVARWWYKITGDSFVVDVKKTYSEGVSFYLAKYVSKGFLDREELERRGFTRRYTTSRSWPSVRRRALGTILEAWDEHREYGPWYIAREKYEAKAEKTAQETGLGSIVHLDDISQELDEQRDFERKKKTLERLMGI